MATVTWHIVIDWNDTGEIQTSGDDYFDEAPYAIGYRSERGRDSLLNSRGPALAIGFGEVKVGKATVTFSNADGRYDPLNDAGDLYGLLTAGHLVQVQAEVSSVIHERFTGRIRSIKPVMGADRVVMEFEELSADLIKGEPRVAITATQRYDEAMQLLLTNAGWPAFAGSSLDASSHTLAYFWADSGTHLETARKLAAGTLGTFFVKADGQARLIDYERILPAYTVWTAADLLKTIELTDAVEDKIDYVEVRGYPPYVGVDIPLWVLPDIVPIDDLETKRFWIDFSYNSSPCMGILEAGAVGTLDFPVKIYLSWTAGGYGTPGYRDGKIATVTVHTAGSGYIVGDRLEVLGSNGEDGYVLVATIDGSGGVTGVTLDDAGYGYPNDDERTTSGGSGTGCTVDIVRFDGGYLYDESDCDLTLGPSYGHKAYIDVMPMTGGPPMYINFLQVGGTVVYNTAPTVVTAGTGTRQFILDSIYVQNWFDAYDYVTWLDTYFGSTRSLCKVQLEGSPAKQYTVDLFDPIHLDDVFGTGIEFIGTISKIVEEWLTPSGEGCRSTVWLEEV